MVVRVMAFASLRELFAAAESSLELKEGARVHDAWKALELIHPALAAERASTRVAINGSIAGDGAILHNGDELALLPPVGGG